jgi:hexulose-6-phosphate isomerase
MKKGINIWSFPAGSIKDNLTLAKNAGFEGVELALNAEGELSMNSTEKELLQIKNTATDLGLELYSLSCGLCWDYRLSDDDEKLREKAKDMIHIMEL